MNGMMGAKMLRDEAVFRRSPRAVFRELADGTGVLLHLDTTAYYSVNRIGAMIWELLEVGSTVPEVARQLRSRLQGTPEGLEDDVAAYVDELRVRELVLIDDASEPGDT
jgi:hypothetical protein